MAKKDDFDLDDWDLDDDLDFDSDFNPPELAVPTGRQAIMSLPKSAAVGAANAVAGPGKRRQLILDSLPKDYSVAASAYDNLASEGSSIYREAKDQLKQTKRELKKAGREVTPVLRQYLPKSLADRVEKWSKDDSSTGNYAEIDPRQAAIDSALSDTFAVREEVRKEKLEERAQTEIKESADILRQNRLHESLAGVHGNTDKMVAYQNSVTTNYRKKMLEISYRQYYTLTDLLEVTKTSMEKLVPASESIVRNTALPDYAKEEFLEVGQAMFKRKILSALSPGDFTRDYMGNLGANAKRAISDFFGGVRDNISMAGGAAGMMDDGDDDSHLSPAQKRTKMAQTGSTLVGGMLAKKYAVPQIKKIQERLRASAENNEGIASFGRRARYNLTNVPEILNSYAKDNSREGQFNFLGSIASMLQDILPQYDGDSVSVGDTTVEELDRAVPWSRRSDLTLNEILPGWLSKIHSAMTGVDEQYDHTTKGFVESRVIEDRIRDTVGDQETKEYVRTEIDRLVERIVGEEEMSEADRRILGRTLEEKIRKVESFDVRDLAENYDGYGSVGGSEDLSDLMNHFSTIVADKKIGEEMNIEVSDELRRIREQLRPVQDSVNEMTDLYGHRAVANAGIYNRDGLGLNEAVTDNYRDVSEIKTDAPEARAQIRQAVVKVGAKATPPSESASFTVRDLTPDVYTGVRDALFSEDPNLYTVLSDVLYGKEREHNLYKVITDACGKLGTRDHQEGAQRLETVVDKIHAQLIENDISPQMDAILDLIEHMAISGVGTYAQPESSDSLGYFGKFGQTVRDKKNKAVEKVKGGYAWGKSKLSSVSSWAKKVTGGPLSVLKGLRDTVTGTVGSAWKGLTGTRDIYDENGNVVISGRMLKMGEYFSADGKVIKSLKDIKGAIYDKAGNVVLSAEEVLKNGGKYTYYSKNGWRKLSEMVGGTAGVIVNKVAGLPRNLIDRLKKPFNSLTNLVRTGNDIYVEGETEPRLKRHLMLKGFYLDKRSGSVIRSVDDITGPVVTREGNEVISDSELADPKFKLVDVHGKPFKSIIGKGIDKAVAVGRFAKNVAGKGFTLLKDAGGYVADLLGTGVEGIKGLFTGGMGGKTASEIKDVLSDIYDLLDERLCASDCPGTADGKRSDKVAGDSDGDGVRDNSFKDIFRRRREAREGKDGRTTNTTVEGEDKKGGILGKVLSGILAAGGFLTGKLTSLFTGLAGTFSKKLLERLTGGFGKLAGKFAKWIMGAMAGKEILDTVTDSFDPDVDVDRNKKEKKTSSKKRKNRRGYGKKGYQRVVSESVKRETAKSASRVAARQVAAQGARTAAVAGATTLASGGLLSGVGSAIGAGAAAVASVLSAPVVLGALAVGTLGYLTYKVATNKTNDPVDRIRFAQYGLKDYKDGNSDQVAKIRYLEAEVAKYTSYTDEGVASLRGFVGDVALQTAKGFGVNLDDADDAEAFDGWFYGRFSPIYLLWASRLRQISPKSVLTDLEGSLTDGYMREAIAKRTLLPEGHPVLQWTRSPFEGGWFGKSDLMSGDDVRQFHLSMIRRLAQPPRVPGKTSEATVSTPVAAPASSRPTTGEDKTLIKPKPSNAKHAGNLPTGGSVTPNTTSADIIMVDATRSNLRKNIIEMTATEAVRMRAYGLTKMKTNKVMTLMALEMDTYPFISSSKSGTTFKGDTNEIAKTSMAGFGMNYDDETQRDTWIGWYSNRFIPILLKYISTLAAHAPNARPFDITESSSTTYLAEVAKSLTWERVTVGGENISVWNITFNPWGDGEPVNTDVSSVRANIEYLESKVKLATLLEPMPRSTGNATAIAAAVNRGGSDGSGVTAMASGGQSGGSSGQYSATGAMVNGDGFNPPGMGGAPGGGGPISASGIPIGEISDPVDPNGAYSKIKLASHSRGDIAKMISEVSKVTGMDENLMLTVGMMESSLRPDAGATTSSAKGLYQFLVGKDGKSGTWGEQLGIHANKYGIPSNASPFDPVANTLLGAEYLRLGAKSVSKLTPSGKASPVDLYLSHFLGPGGARTFLRGLRDHPDASLLPKYSSQAAANKDIFTVNGRGRTYREMYSELQRRARVAYNSVSKYASNPGQAVEVGTPPTPAMPQQASASVAAVSPAGTPPAADSGLKEPMSPEQRDATTVAKAKQDVQQATAAQSQGAVSTITPSEAVSAGGAIATKAVETVKATVADKPHRVDMDRYESTVRDEVMTNTVAPAMDLTSVMSSITRQQVAIAESTNGILNKQLEAQREMVEALIAIRNHLIDTPAGAPPSRPAAPPNRKAGPEIVHQQGIISMARERG